MKPGELPIQDRCEVDKQREGQQMGVEQVGSPVVSVFPVDILNIGAHVGGKKLGNEQDQETSLERSAGEVDPGSIQRFALNIENQ